MKRFSTLLLVLVAGFAAYTHWQVIQLQQEIRDPEAQAARSRVTITEADDVAGSLADARRRCRRAKYYLDRGQTSKARQEMDKCLQELTRAADLSEGDNKGNRELVQGWQEIKRQIDTLWKDFAEQAKPPLKGN